jgi:oligogalacturonide lyase
MKRLFMLASGAMIASCITAQPVLQTGGQKMPAEWIDKDTHHRVIKLTANLPGNSTSFYFHNNCFVGNEMIFYNSSNQKAEEVTDMKRAETSNHNARNKQIYKMDLSTRKITQLTFEKEEMGGEIVSVANKKVYYQIKDTVFAVNISNGKREMVYVFPEDFKAGITTINADGTLLAGSKGTDEEREIYKNHPEKKDFFNLIFEAKLPKTLFTVDIKTGKLNKIFTDSAWLNHVQFSSTDPSLLMFCHEGPWHKLDRIWTININTKEVKLMHKRTIVNEIAGHEWFGNSGKIIWYDLQQPKGETFFVSGTDVNTLKEVKYALQRNEWSVHYTSNSTETIFAGDGGDPGSVAKASNGQWIYLFTPAGNKFNAEKLVNLKYHHYKLEPNVHFSPDNKWIIFRANFEGEANVYAVEIAKSNQ